MSKATLFADLRIILRHLNKLPSRGVNSFKAHTIAQVWFINIYCTYESQPRLLSAWVGRLSPTTRSSTPPSSPKAVFTQVVSVDVLAVRSAPYYWHFFTVGKIATQQQITGAMAVRLKSSVFWLCRVRLLLFLYVPRQLARGSLALVAPSYSQAKILVQKQYRPQYQICQSRGWRRHKKTWNSRVVLHTMVPGIVVFIPISCEY